MHINFLRPVLKNDVMNFNSHTWVCATCGQGFTRKSTAVRHNKNLHSGMAMVVRPHEYIIGRLSKKFPESDPSLYRRRQYRGRNNTASSENIARTSGLSSPNVTHETMHGFVNHPRPMEPNSIGNFGTQFNNANLESYNQPTDLKSADSLGKLSERRRKLNEFEILAKKLQPRDIANQMIIIVKAQTFLGDDAFLEKNLAALRSMERAKAC
jgi:uncharacterized Zn-finger protein